MNDLTEKELLSLLQKKQVTNKELKNAYEKFTEEMKNINQPENEYTITYRGLNLARIELVSLSNHFRYEQGEKCA